MVNSLTFAIEEYKELYCLPIKKVLTSCVIICAFGFTNEAYIFMPRLYKCRLWNDAIWWLIGENTDEEAAFMFLEIAFKGQNEYATLK